MTKVARTTGRRAQEQENKIGRMTRILCRDNRFLWREWLACVAVWRCYSRLSETAFARELASGEFGQLATYRVLGRPEVHASQALTCDLVPGILMSKRGRKRTF